MPSKPGVRMVSKRCRSLGGGDDGMGNYRLFPGRVDNGKRPFAVPGGDEMGHFLRKLLFPILL